MWRLAYKLTKRGQPNKPRNWVTTRYFGALNKKPRAWEQWFNATRKATRKQRLAHPRYGGAHDTSNLQLVHTRCHRRYHPHRHKDGTSYQPANATGLA